MLKFNDLVAIAVDEPLLLKCGFELYDKEWTMVHKDDEGDADRSILTFSIGLLTSGDFGIMNHDGGLMCEFKYLHQLQNIYFALTGEELQVNL